ncbi:MAG: FG-GAP-like repeat-containing protein [Candidatus Neomarinimicrobiota bacterium]|nr:FG-GAP-like repeat-containing protein [Candidatus Neomarinimicrobiota bacterium]
MNKIVKGLMFLSLGTFLFSQNILSNSGFESGDFTGWNIWPTDLTNRSVEKTGNDIYSGVAGTDTVTARSGSYMLKTWGQNTSADNTTPNYQEFTTEAGKVYNFSAYGKTFSPDSLKGKSKAWLQIKFFNASWGELAGGTSDTMSDASSVGDWHYLYTNATAPEGAVKVQAVIVHGQSAANDGGSVYWDDTYFTTNHFTELAVVSSKNLWSGSGHTRGVAAGTDVDGDGKQEVWTTHYFTDNKNGLAGSGVYGFEYVGTDTLVQIFDETKPFAPGNVLANGGFEDSLTGWNIWPTDLTNRSIEKTGNDIYSGTAGTDTVTALNGSYMLKTWGQNNGADNTTPSYYEGDTKAGMNYAFGGYGNTFSPDSLKDKSQAWLQIKFFDANWGELAGGTSDTLSAASAPNKWHFLRTSAIAPEGAAKVQAVIVHSQSAAYDGGSVYWDDMNLSVLPSKIAKYSTGTRHVNTGDLDGDGKQEVIFFKGVDQPNDPNAGLYVYEADGTDNGFSEVWHVNLHAISDDSMGWGRTESFTVGDIDGDGLDEVVYSMNGASTGAADKSNPYSEDRFYIVGVKGDIGGALPPTLVEEYAVATRDGNKDNVRENQFGGGSPQSVVIADTDGDGKLEAACFSWNNHALFFIEATGADTYAVSDTTSFHKFASRDDFTFNPAAIDMDGDGKDEIYSAAYYSKKLYVYADTDGDALTMSADEAAVVAMGPQFGVAAVQSVKDHGAGYFNMSPYGVPTLFAGGSTGSELTKVTLKEGASVLGGPSSWDVVVYNTGNHGAGFVNKPVAGVDFNRNGRGEVVLNMMSATDGRTQIQIMEYSETSVKLSVDRELTIITPEDYKLSQNYPNPFNPTTTIQYTLPMRDKITVTVYNMLGQEVVRLLNNEEKPAGTYQLSWNGMDKNGVQVSSGMYIYSMSSPHMRKTMRMTFLK